MGYTTQFTGSIKPNRELKASEISFMQEIFDEEHHAEKGWDRNFAYIDLQFNKTYSGFQWNGAEKSYGMENQVQYAINKTVAKYPDLIFNGEMKAQGEEYDDRWILSVKDNIVSVQQIVLKGKKVTCPHCQEKFILEETE